MINKKREIRTKIKELRMNLSDISKNYMSDKIFKNLIATKEYKNAKVLYIYVAANNEVETQKIIELAFEQGKEVAVPKIEKGVMKFYNITSFDELQPGYFGILEPCSESIPKTPDIVIVPGVAFSLRKERIGYGGGFYDSFLTDNVTKIALAYQFQIYDELPTEPHDVIMDMIITENKIIK